MKKLILQKFKNKKIIAVREKFQVVMFYYFDRDEKIRHESNETRIFFVYWQAIEINFQLKDAIVGEKRCKN